MASLNPKKIGLALGISLFVIAGGLIFESRYAESFYPGISIGGKPVDGKTYEEVFADFKKRAGELTENGFQIVLAGKEGEKKIFVPISISGLTADNLVEYFSLGDWEGTIRQAYQSGRSGSLMRRFAEQLSGVFSGHNFALPAEPRKYALQSLLSRELTGFFKEAVPAQFVYDGARMIITKEKSGEGISVEEITSAIGRKLTSFDTSAIYFSIPSIAPAITAKNLGPFLKLANDVAASINLVFYYRGDHWRVRGRTLATWLTIKSERGEIGIDDIKLKNFLAKTVAPLIDDPPRNSQFEMNNGALVEIVPGKPGNVVDIPKTMRRVEEIVYNIQGSYAQNGNIFLALASAISPVTKTAQTGTIEIQIETTQADPPITRETINNYGIKDLVGFSKTSFKGSSLDRKHNIEIGAGKLSGVLIAPGEEFSAVRAIGTTTEEEGFVKEFVIIDNKSVKELGGGLCQLATTLFRLALNTGLPVTERVNHRYVVSYYGPGLDATIYGPEPDLRFVNDTGNYLLLQGRVEGNEVMFELYGQKDGRRAQISKPILTNEIPAPDIKYLAAPDMPLGETKCSETPHKGITADVNYSVYYPNGFTRKQAFHSVYQPWQRICLVGLGMK